MFGCRDEVLYIQLALRLQDNLTPLEIAQQRKLSEALIKLLVP